MLSGSESMESVDHTSDCPMQLFFYELQMAVKALLKQINIPLHQVLVFTIIFIFFLWLMETALWWKTQEVKQYTYIILSLMYMSLCTHLHVFSLMPVRGPWVHVCTFTLVPPCWRLPEFPDPTSLWSGQTRKNWLTHPERHQILASGEHEAREVNK